MPEIALLLGRGASPTDADANGRTVAAAVSSRWGRYELLARIRARLRTAEQPVSTELSHGRVTIDMRTREVHVGGRSVELSPREFPCWRR